MKNKYTLSQLMITGIISGLFFSKQAFSEQNQIDSDFLKLVEETKGNMTYHLMTEDELMLELNEEGAHIYRSLSSEGKQLALRAASRACDHTNDCSGLNACSTDKNKCAGEGSCKETGKCAFSDKNLAVKVVAKKMAEKRIKAQGG